ncbi:MULTISPECIES: hypothetical protein [Corallococcus]|nr:MULTISPECIES: hypothetical protein [Corallococcus]NBD09121.1 hypothetical protein [Corallococcus silvisoli]
MSLKRFAPCLLLATDALAAASKPQTTAAGAPARPAGVMEVTVELNVAP